MMGEVKHIGLYQAGIVVEIDKRHLGDFALTFAAVDKTLEHAGFSKKILNSLSAEAHSHGAIDYPFSLDDYDHLINALRRVVILEFKGCEYKPPTFFDRLVEFLEELFDCKEKPSAQEQVLAGIIMRRDLI